MNNNGMDSGGGNGGGHHPHGHLPPPEHHGQYQYDPQGQPYPYGGYGNYYPPGYFHPDGGAPPPHHHQYHEGQYYPPPYYHDPHYGMEHPHNVPHHLHENYRMDDGHDRQIQMQEQPVHEQDKTIEPVMEPTEQSVESQNDRSVRAMQTEHVRMAEAPAGPKGEDHAQKAQVKAETSTASESLGASDGKEFHFEDVLTALQTFKAQHGHANIPRNHAAFIKIVNVLVNNDIEKETDKLWERKFTYLKEYKTKYGDCDIPYNDPNMGEWMALHRKMKADGVSDPLAISRLAKLDQIGFEWDLTVWDKRLIELTEFTKEHKHTDVPINHSSGLGIWVINQKFNLHEMSKERVAALDALDFIWNHNRKRNNKTWDVRYNELLEYKEKHKTTNVPTTQGHSKLSKWVGKQREEYKKYKNKQSSQLDRERIDRLNKIGFQWSLQSYSVIPWDERFEALKKYKEEHGHLKIPRSNSYFGNWPNWQRTQYKLYLAGKESKITKEKIDKLIAIGFFKP